VRYLPCPIVDLRHVVARYNFEDFRDYQSTPYRSPLAHHSLAVDFPVYEKAFYLLNALREMADVTLQKATNLNDIWLRMIGLQSRRDGESYLEAARRIRDSPKVDPASAENLSQKIFQWGCEDAGVERDASTHRLAVFGERQLLLVIPKDDREEGPRKAPSAWSDARNGGCMLDG
jgi:hypothetical protein